MKERPILFSGPMIRAILDGRKTQTRRVVKPAHIHPEARTLRWENQTAEEIVRSFRCPLGVPGDRLWCKETWMRHPDEPTTIFYRATDDLPWDQVTDFIPWKPSIFMPRELSRITLEIVRVRVERLHDIGKDGRKAHDVLAEGITPEAIAREREWFHQDDSPALAFSRLWDSINGKKHPWASNPFVWCLSFRRITNAS